MSLISEELARLGVEEYLRAYQQRDLLRFLTCGSVDDGKSTLIGRLLHDSEMVYDDQLAAAKRDTIKHGTTEDELDFALLIDGLEAEREQGITIDVAYRYFSTPRRKFIIADTPGHEQYTRNMATGASGCNLAVILVDARKGVLDQTRRHAFIASLLGIRHLVVAVNKMDLVGYSQQRFEEIRNEFTAFAAKLQASDVYFIPVSALRGENVVTRAASMPWYLGSPLLDYLETAHIAGDRNLIDLRLPVQYVLRPDASFRGYCGTVASGVIRTGQEVLVLPAAVRTRVRSIETFDGEITEAVASMAVVVTLADEVDVSRGDMLVAVNNVPQLARDFEAMLVWMGRKPLTPGREYLLKQTAVQAPAVVTDVRYRMNVNTLHREETAALALNEIGRVRVETPRLLAFDDYALNRGTGAFILIDRLTNETVAAGMILQRESAESVVPVRHAEAVDRSLVSAAERTQRLGQTPHVVVVDNAARAWDLERELFDAGRSAHVLDPEALRGSLNSDLGNSVLDAKESARRVIELSRAFQRLGFIVIVPSSEEVEEALSTAGMDVRRE